MTVLRIVSVKTGAEVSRAVLADDGQTVTYEGGDSAASAVRRHIHAEGGTEADAVRTLAVEGWSNGYLMVELTS